MKVSAASKPVIGAPDRERAAMPKFFEWEDYREIKGGHGLSGLSISLFRDLFLSFGLIASASNTEIRIPPIYGNSQLRDAMPIRQAASDPFRR